MSGPELVTWDPGVGSSPVLGAETAPPKPANPRSSRLLLSYGFVSGEQSLEAACEAAAARSAAASQGAFAYVWWDENRRRLTAYSDRNAHHSWFYAVQDGAVVVGRSARAVAEWIGTPTPDPVAIASFLAGGGGGKQNSFYTGVERLEAGKALEFDGGGSCLRSQWTLEPPAKERRRSDASYIAELEGLLGTVVSDFSPRDEFGITLSGGLDSGAVAAFARASRPDLRIVALRAATRELPGADESSASAAASQSLGLADHEFDVSHLYPMSSAGTLLTLPDSPFSPPYPEWYASLLEAARSAGVARVLLGLGGDNLFGAFVRSYPELLASLRMRALFEGLARDPTVRGRNPLKSAWRQAVAPWFKTRHHAPGKGQPKPWVHSSLTRLAEESASVSKSLSGLSPGRARRFELIDSPLVEQTVTYVVEAGRRMGIDVRCPLWDARLREFALRLPSDLCYRPPHDKWILREVLRDRLPAAVVEGKKRSLAPLGLRGFRDEAKAKIQHLMSDMRAAEFGFVEPGPLKARYDDFVAGKHEDIDFWESLCLEAWLRQHF